MKDAITEAINSKLSGTLEGLGGAGAIYGDPITLGGEELIPVARIRVRLSSAADGGGGGDSGAGLSAMAKGTGGGKADAGMEVDIEPVGVIRSTDQGPELVSLDDR